MSYAKLIEKIAWKIIRERKVQKIDQISLSKKAGVGEKTIYKIENFKANPTIKTLDKIATALGLTIEDLCNADHKKGGGDERDEMESRHCRRT